mmetsp:Transcript_26856/g.55047  ORF Transcript_26856/g.55047 Transcript_26856/m.55047 type:complete len:99 (-) Transcript_26856:151-447(-)
MLLELFVYPSAIANEITVGETVLQSISLIFNGASLFFRSVIFSAGEIRGTSKFKSTLVIPRAVDLVVLELCLMVARLFIKFNASGEVSFSKHAGNYLQ